jgi:hypothetical protein
MPIPSILDGAREALHRGSILQDVGDWSILGAPQNAEYSQMADNHERIRQGDQNVNLVAFRAFISGEINEANSDGEDRLRLLLRALYPTDHFRESFNQLDNLSQQRVKDFLYGESTSDIVRDALNTVGSQITRSTPPLESSGLSSILPTIKAFLMKCLGFRKNSEGPVANDPASYQRIVPVVSVTGGSTPVIIEDANGKTMEVHSGLSFDN